jgi:hypothetical protein
MDTSPLSSGLCRPLSVPLSRDSGAVTEGEPLTLDGEVLTLDGEQLTLQ